MSGLFCGLDIGSTNMKVLLMNADGETVWVKSAATPRIDDGIGPVTNGLSLVQALEELIIAGWNEVGQGKPLAAIASAGIGEDGFCLDKELRPLGHAIPWFDHRDQSEASELLQSQAAAKFPAINFAFATAAAKWLWLSRHRPHEVPRDATWVALTDFPLVHWTRKPFISETLLARSGVFDVFLCKAIPELEAMVAAPVLPPSCVAGSVIGTVEHGPLRRVGAASANTLCVAGGHDHPVASSAIMRVHPLARVDSLGTANAIYGETQNPTPSAARAGIDLTRPVRGGRGIATLGPLQFTGPLVHAFGSEDAVRRLLSVPHIAGVPAPVPPIIAADHDDPDPIKLRLLLEALAWQARLFLLCMAAAGVGEGPVFATGGWARSRALLELRASVFGAPLTAIHEPELTALGAALFAAEAVTACAPEFMRHRDVETIEPRSDWTAVYRLWQ